MTQVKQLELFKVVVVQPPLPEKPEFEKFCAKLRAESFEMLVIANELFGQGWENLANVPISNLFEVRSEFNRRHSLVPPYWEVEGFNAGKDHITIRPGSKPVRSYQPWTHERKVIGRLRRLHERIQKKWSLINMKQDALYEAVLDNPQYFGVCPLPGSIESSRITLPNLAKVAAITKEMQLRDYKQFQENNH